MRWCISPGRRSSCCSPSPKRAASPPRRGGSGSRSPPASRRLSQLESLLGERLFVRSVEGVAPTPFGERMLEPARRMAEWAGEVEPGRGARRDVAARRRPHHRAAGSRVRAPRAVRRVALRRPPRRPARGRLVGCTTSISYGGRPTSRSGCRPGTRRNSSRSRPRARRRRLRLSRRTRRRCRRSPRLSDIAWLGWAPPLEHLSPNPELAKLIPGFRPVFASDDFLVQLRAAEAGIGALFLGRARHRFSASNARRAGRRPRHSERSLHLVCAKTALDIPRVRAVADLLVAELRAAKETPRRQSPPPSPSGKRTAQSTR